MVFIKNWLVKYEVVIVCFYMCCEVYIVVVNCGKYILEYYFDLN